MAKAAAVVLFMTLIVSTYTTRANGFDIVSSSQPIIRLRYFSYVDPRGLSTVEVGAAPASMSGAQAPAPSNGGDNKQSWSSWFEKKMGSVSNMFGSSGKSGAPAPAPAPSA